MNIFSSEAMLNNESYLYYIAVLSDVKKALDEQNEDLLNHYWKDYHLDSCYDSTLYRTFYER